jgi:hypothetical protein
MRELLACLLLAVGSSAPSLYRGFRFECSPSAGSAHVLAVSVRDLADEASAFGWVQVTRGARVVGEFRGAATVAPSFEAGMAAAAAAAGAAAPCATREYADTLISLHFSDFKILTDDRETCFAEPPHACGAGRAGAGGSDAEL